MTHVRSAVALGLALVLAVGSTVVASPAPVFPTLVSIQAAHHRGFDRIVFEFSGGLPKRTSAAWVDRVTNDPSDKPVPVQGNAFISVVMSNVRAHEDTEPFATTYGARKRAFDLPNIAHVVAAGDFEAVVSFGVGLMKRTSILRTSRLRDPGRFVIDVSTTFDKKPAVVAFADGDGAVPASIQVPGGLALAPRTVPAGGQANGALLRLWAGPTEQELAAGLHFVASRTKGFRDLRIDAEGVARLTLKGTCDGEGAALTVADEILATLKPLPTVEWVKIYDGKGLTQHPWGRRDSIPDCLAP
jgi:hypothetical protein